MICSPVRLFLRVVGLEPAFVQPAQFRNRKPGVDLLGSTIELPLETRVGGQTHPRLKTTASSYRQVVCEHTTLSRSTLSGGEYSGRPQLFS